MMIQPAAYNDICKKTTDGKGNKLLNLVMNSNIGSQKVKGKIEILMINTETMVEKIISYLDVIEFFSLFNKEQFVSLLNK